MSTMAIAAAPEVAAPTVASTAGRRLSGLFRAFWYKLKAVAAPVFSVVVGIAKTIARPVLVFAAPPVGQLAIAGGLATHGGRSVVGTVISKVASGVAWGVRKVASVVHQGINMVGRLFAGFVGLFSKRGEEKVNSAVESFSNGRVMAAAWIQHKVVTITTRIRSAATTPLVHGAVGAVAIGIAALVVVNLLAPASLLAAVSSANFSPWAAGNMLKIAAGTSLHGVAALATTAGVATGASMLLHKEPAVVLVEETTEMVVVEAPEQPKPTRVSAASSKVIKGEVVTEVAEAEEEPELIPGKTPISQENADEERRKAEGEFQPGPGKRSYPAQKKHK